MDIESAIARLSTNIEAEGNIDRTGAQLGAGDQDHAPLPDRQVIEDGGDLRTMKIEASAGGMLLEAQETAVAIEMVMCRGVVGARGVRVTAETEAKS